MELSVSRIQTSNIIESEILNNCRTETNDSLSNPPEPLWVVKRPNSSDYELIWDPSNLLRKFEEVPAVMIEQTEEPRWTLTCRLWLRHGTMNALEKGFVINYLLENGVDQDDVLKTMNNLLGLPRSESWLKTYKKLSQLSESFQHQLANDQLDPRHVHYLKDVRPELREELIDKFAKNALSLSVQQTRKIEEAGRRLDDEEVKSVVQMLKHLPEETADPDKAGEQFLNYIKKKAYPRTTRRKESFNQTLSDLDLNGQIQVSPPNNFEGDYIDFRIRCHRDQSLEDLAEDLKKCQTLLNEV